MRRAQAPPRATESISAPAPQTKKGEGANWYAPKIEPGKLEPFNELTRLRHWYSDLQKWRYRREQRMGLVGDRPESDFDTELLGNAILEFAKEYRKVKPEATLSEAADQFFINLKQVSFYDYVIHGNSNGKGTPNI